MTSLGRAILCVVGAVLLLLGLVLGLVDRDYSAAGGRTSCGSVLSPTTFIVFDQDEPLVDEAARCAAEMAQAAPQVWTLLGSGGVLLVVAVASLAGQPPTRRRPVSLRESGG